jgi:hypothetical protein
LLVSIENNNLLGEAMKDEDYQFFRENGYVSLGKILTDREVDYYLDLYDHDREQKQAFWFDFGSYQTIRPSITMSWPAPLNSTN